MEWEAPQGRGANRIRDSGFRGENEEHPLSADVEWEAPQGRGGQTGFGIQDSGEGTKSICFPPSADGLAMQDSGFRIQDQVRE